MRFRFVIEYSSDESAEAGGEHGVHDSIESVLMSVLPYMVDNVDIYFEELVEEDV